MPHLLAGWLLQLSILSCLLIGSSGHRSCKNAAAEILVMIVD
jgi:hypothetical protein